MTMVMMMRRNSMMMLMIMMMRRSSMMMLMIMTGAPNCLMISTLPSRRFSTAVLTRRSRR